MRQAIIILATLLSLSLTACATAQPTPTATLTPIPTFSPTDTSTPLPTRTPTITTTPVPRFSFRAMSYNLLYGAGVDPKWYPAIPLEFTGRNRLTDVLAIVKKVDPAILAIEEANSWDLGTPTIIQQVARELGMNSYLARTPGGFHIGILTKFGIAETENYASEIGRQGALRALLVTPDGEQLSVFVTHLDPNRPEVRLCEVNTLLGLMQPYLRRRTILIGDMNFRPASPEFGRLQAAGWKSVAVEPSLGIDQMWIYPSVVWDTTPGRENLLVPSGLSDHYPVAAEFNLYPTITATLTTPTLAAPPQTPLSIPLFVSNTLSGIQILRREYFQDPCAVSRWNSRWTTEKIAQNRLEVEGEERWQAFAARYKEFAPGEGILLHFQFAPGPEFEMYLENGNIDSDAYHRYGINVRDRALQAVVWDGPQKRHTENLGDDTHVGTSTGYYLLLGTSKSGEVIVQVWDQSDLSRILKTRQKLSVDAATQPWVFHVAANRGKVWVDEETEISFADLK